MNTILFYSAVIFGLAALGFYLRSLRREGKKRSASRRLACGAAMLCVVCILIYTFSPCLPDTPPEPVSTSDTGNAVHHIRIDDALIISAVVLLPLYFFVYMYGAIRFLLGAFFVVASIILLKWYILFLLALVLIGCIILHLPENLTKALTKPEPEEKSILDKANEQMQKSIEWEMVDEESRRRIYGD